MEGTRAATGVRCARAALAVALALVAAAVPAVRAEALSASTDVYVRTLPVSLRITAVTEDISGSAEEVRSMSLSVEAEGEGDISFSWERSAGGSADDAFRCAGATCPLSDVEPDTDYVYTVTASDGFGATDRASVHVSVEGEASDYFIERVTYPAYGATVEARIRTGSHLQLQMHMVGTDMFALLLSRAQGAWLFPPAYTVRIVDAAEGVSSHEGDISVSFAVPSGPSFIERAWADEGDAVQRSVFMLDDDGGSRTLVASESAGQVEVSLPTLGSFALVDESARTPLVPPAVDSAQDGSAGDDADGFAASVVLVPTGDRAFAVAASLAALGALALALVAARLTSRRLARVRHGLREAGR